MGRTLGVIGKGIQGLIGALTFLRSGWRVVVVSHEPGASAAAGGVLALKGQYMARDPAFVAKVDGFRALRDLLGDLEQRGRHVPCAFDGVYEAIGQPADYWSVVHRVYKEPHLGLAGTAFVPPTVLPSLFQDAPQPIWGAIHYPDDGWFCVASLLIALEDECRSLGAELVPARVHAIRTTPDGALLQTEAGAVAVDAFLCAAGSGTDDLMRRSGWLLHDHVCVWGETWQFSRGGAQGAVVEGLWSMVATGSQIRVGSTSWTDVSPGGDFGAALGRTQHVQRLVQGLNLSAPRSLVGARVRTRSRQPRLLVVDDARAVRGVVVSGLYKSGFSFAQPLAQAALALIETGCDESIGWPYRAFLERHRCR